MNDAPRTIRTVGRPSGIGGLLLPEPQADAAGQARERGRVLHEKVAGPGQVHGDDVDDPTRGGDMTTTRSARMIDSTMSCVTKSTVLFHSCQSRSSSNPIFCL